MFVWKISECPSSSRLREDGVRIESIIFRGEIMASAVEEEDDET